MIEETKFPKEQICEANLLNIDLILLGDTMPETKREPMDIDVVKENINQWIIEFLEIPNESLGGWSPCPYARNARINKTYDVRVGSDLVSDLESVVDMGSWDVIIHAYPVDQYTGEEFSAIVDQINSTVMVSRNMIVLEDHPEMPEVVNGVFMNNGHYALTIMQSLSDLNEKSTIIAKKGFYDGWPDRYLDLLFKYRKDPRSE